MSGVSVSLSFDRLPGLGESIRAQSAEAVLKSLQEMQGDAMRNAHVITGSMRASIYYSINGGDSDYSDAASEAASLNKRAVILPETEPTTSTVRDSGGKFALQDGLFGVLGVAVLHGIFEEERAGHQFLLPAAEAERPQFLGRMSRVAVVP